MNFWTVDKIKEALPDCILHNFYENWTSSGLRIWHEDFEAGNIALMRCEGDKRGIINNNIQHVINKACAIMCSKGNIDKFIPYNLPIIEVNNNDDAILCMAKYIRKNYNGKVIAVTGSTGKSTVTRMIYDVLSPYSVSANLNNANTSWGISWNMTTFATNSNYWIIETSLGGGLIRNSKIVLPDTAIITNVAPVHLREGQSLSNIALEKSKIFDSMSPGKTAILYNEMSYFDIAYTAAKQKGLKIITFGENDDADIQIITGEQNIFKIFGKEYIFNDKILPIHILIDMSIALAVVYDLGLSIEDALKILNEFQTLSGRGEVFEGRIFIDKKITLIDESYNANPLSMKFSLDGFNKICPQKANKVLILGDMTEGGTDSLKYHLELSRQLKEINPARVLLCGENMKELWRFIKTDYIGECYDNVEALNADVISWLKDGDFVFVKASHSVGLFKTVQLLKNAMSKY